MTDFGTPTLLTLLGSEDRDVLRSLGRRQRYADGAVVHERGDGHAGLSIVMAGKVRFFRLRRGGQEIYEGAVLPGQNYGDISALFRLDRTHGAVAVGETQIDHIDPAGFERILAHHPAIVAALYRVAAFRLIYANEVLDDMRSLPSEVLLAKTLRTMYRAAPQPEGRIRCLQEDLAALLGLSGVSLAKALRKLEAEGLVRTGYRELILPDLARLETWLAQRVSI